MAITGRDEGESNAVGDFDSADELLSLNVQAVVHDFDEVSVAEQFVKPLGNFNRVVEVLFSAVAATVEDRLAEFARHTSAEANDAFAVSFQKLLIDSRLEIETLEGRRRSHFDQVVKTGFVLAKKREVIGRIFPSAIAFHFAAAGRDVGFVADDRIDVVGSTGVIEFQRAVHVAMIRQRQRGHAVIFGPLYQFRNRTGAVKQRIVAVAMQMCEGARFRHFLPWLEF